MNSAPVRDLVIVLPGILGSTLSINGQPVWGNLPTGLKLQWQRECLLSKLQLQGDDPNVDDLGDGVVATGLVSDIQIIPGFIRIDGYNRLWQALRDRLQLQAGDVFAPHPTANLYVFPYDWRRDNRVAARRLEAFIAEQLPVWRMATGASDARVILVAHSMGGLVARYYLEVLGGWEVCRALFTLGTPHRGSWDALNYLMNGYKVLTVDMRPAMQTFTSVYQLLPTYKGLNVGDSYVGISDATTLPAELRQQAATAKAHFYDPITQAARQRHKDPDRPSVELFSVVGTNQPTLQGGWMANTLFVPHPAVPQPLIASRVPGDGDNTVPAFAAIPQEYASIRDGKILPVVERHSSLQTNEFVLDNLIWHIETLQAPGGWDIHAPGDQEQFRQPALRLHLEAAYPTEGGTIWIELADSDHPNGLTATVTPLDPVHSPFNLTFAQHDDIWQAELACPPGLYRINWCC